MATWICSLKQWFSETLTRKPAACATPGNLLEIQTLSPHHRPAHPTWDGASNVSCNKFFRWFWCPIKSKNPCHKKDFHILAIWTPSRPKTQALSHDLQDPRDRAQPTSSSVKCHLYRPLLGLVYSLLEDFAKKILMPGSLAHSVSNSNVTLL